MKPLIAILLALFCTAVSSTEAAVIRLRAESQVSGSLILLGAIAEITEATPEELAQLQRITIAPAPAAGKTVRISLDTIRRELSLRGIDQTDLQFTGGTEALVKQPVVPTEEETTVPAVIPATARQLQQLSVQVQTLVQQHIQRHAPELQKLRIELSESQLQQCLTQAPSAGRWSIAGGQLPWIGEQQLTLTGVQADGQVFRTILNCQISQRPRALALKQGLPRGQVIREADLVWLEVEDTTHFLTDPQQAIGTETVRSIRADAPLQPTDVRPLPLVRRNDVVSVTVQIGAIQVRRYCRSLEEGTLGQTIVLTPVDGKEKIMARVSGLREAKIALQVNDLTAPVPTKTSGLKLTPASSTATPQAAGQHHPASQHQQPVSPTPLQNRSSSPSPSIMPASASTSSSGRILSNRPARLPE